MSLQRSALRYLLPLLLMAPTAFAQPAAEVVQFAKRPARVGDAVDQQIYTATQLTRRTRREQKILETREHQSERTQQRIVTALALGPLPQAESDRPAAEMASPSQGVVEANVEFIVSQSESDGKTAQDSIVGKRYRCKVNPQGKLSIVDPEGNLPPAGEYTLVAEAMASLGKPNPLSDYLAGRAVRLGEQLQLPDEVAQRAVGMGTKATQVERFMLTLSAIEEIEGRQVAQFSAEIEAIGAGSEQMRVLLTGTLRVEAATCRVVSTDLSGPIGMSAVRGSLSNKYQVDGTGRLQTKLNARFRDAE